MTDRALGYIIETYAATRDTERDTQAGSFGMCVIESRRFVEWLADRGVYAEVIAGRVYFDVAELGEFDAGHAVVLLYGHVIDWTARQFYPAAPVPLVVPYDDWRAAWEPTEVPE